MDDDLRRGTLSSLREAIPKDLQKKIEKANDYANGDDLIQVLVERSTNICASGFHLTGIKNATRNSRVQFYKDLGAEHDLDQLTREMFETLIAEDHCILAWFMELRKTKPRKDELPYIRGQIRYIQVMIPGTYEYRSAGGTEELWVEPGEDVKAAVRRGSPEDQKFLRGVLPKYIDAARLNQKVKLEEKDGEFFTLLRTRGRRAEGLPSPSMCPTFPWIIIRTQLKDGDYALAYKTAALIELVTAGETSHDPMDPKKTWLKKTDRDALEKKFRDPSKCKRIIGNHTLDVKWRFPDPASFDIKKYLSCETNILRWAGICITLLDGTGGGYASGFIAIKPFVAKVTAARNIVRRALEKMFGHKSVKPYGLADGRVPGVKFNPNVLKDDRQVLAEVKAMLEAAGISFQTALESLDYSPDTELLRKREERKNPEDYTPIFSTTTGGAPGRPETNITPPATDARQNREPRPSTAGKKAARGARKGTK